MSNTPNTSEDETHPSGDRLSSETLAALIVDALVSGGSIDKGNLKLAATIAAQEIEIRKCLGDY